MCEPHMSTYELHVSSGECLQKEEQSSWRLVDGLRKDLPVFGERVAVSKPIMGRR